MAKIENTERRLYACSFLKDPSDEKSEIVTVRISPGVNIIDSSLMKGFLAHPNVKKRFDLGIFKEVRKGEPIVSDDDKAKAKAKAKVKAEGKND